MTVNEILNAVKELKVFEVVELVKALEEEFGVSAAPMVGVVPQVTTQETVEEEEAPTEFNLTLEGFGVNKIAVIKTVRSMRSDLGLKEAKDLVESAPVTVFENVTKEEADKGCGVLEAAGAACEVRPV